MSEVISQSAGREPDRHVPRSLLALISVLAVVGSLTWGVGSASAENVHVLSQTVTGPTNTPFNNPRGVAVDNSSGLSAGSVYVGDTSNHRIVKYDPAGNFLFMWGRNVNEGTGPTEFCTNAGPPTEICIAGSNGNGPGWASQPVGMAVDPSAGPSAGDLYVAPDAGNTGFLEKFDPTGHLVTAWGGSPFPGGFDGATAPGGPFSCCSLGRLTVDQSGNLIVYRTPRFFKFAQDASSPSSFVTPRSSNFGQGVAVDGAGNLFQINNDSTVEKIGPAGADLGQVTTTSYFAQALAYDAIHNDLFVSAFSFANGSEIALYHFNGLGEVVQADSTTCMPAPSPFAGCNPTETFGREDLSPGNGGPAGLAVNTSTRKVYVANSGGNNIRVFSLINVPKVTTEAASSVARDSVKFNGHVDPDGAGEVTSCLFEYGTTTAYGKSAPCLPATSAVPASVSAQLPAESLASQTLYHYRLVAGNSNGSRNAKDQTFTTLTAVAGVNTPAATNVARLTATLNGSFTGDGVDTSYYFEYGPTEEYGQKTTDIDHGTASGPQTVHADLSGLYAYYFYHYRLVAHNKYGTTFGPDQTFHTEAPELPTVENTFASEVDQDSAKLNAQLDLGEGLTVYRFEYGATEAYGTRTLVDGPLDPEGSNHTATAALSELSSGTTYHFRVIATNFTGTTVGPDEMFTTPSAPAVDSTSATGVTRTSATLGALINPGLSLSTYHFDYGRTPAYGSGTPESAPIGPDNVSHAISVTLSGLTPGAVYHFRAVATNAVGVTVGFDRTFTTLPPEEVKPPPEEKCRKGFVRKHGKCVRRKHRKHARGRH